MNIEKVRGQTVAVATKWSLRDEARIIRVSDYPEGKPAASNGAGTIPDGEGQISEDQIEKIESGILSSHSDILMH